jgi:hypothetical protein
MSKVIPATFRNKLPRPEGYWRCDPGENLIRRFTGFKPDLKRAKDHHALYSTASYHLAKVYKPDRLVMLTLDQEIEPVNRVRTIKQEVVRNIMTREVEITIEGLSEEFPVRIEIAPGKSDPRYPAIDPIIERSLGRHELVYVSETQAAEQAGIITGVMNRPRHEFYSEIIEMNLGEFPYSSLLIAPLAHAPFMKELKDVTVENFGVALLGSQQSRWLDPFEHLQGLRVYVGYFAEACRRLAGSI